MIRDGTRNRTFLMNNIVDNLDDLIESGFHHKFEKRYFSSVQILQVKRNHFVSVKTLLFLINAIFVPFLSGKKCDDKFRSVRKRPGVS